MFTTAGPVAIHSCRTPWGPDTLRPGDDVYFTLSLCNRGSATTASDIAVVVTPENDTLAIPLAGSEFSFGDIAAGDTTSVVYYSVSFSENIPGDSDLRFYLSIASEGFTYWSDTFRVHVALGTFEGDNALPVEYALYQNYPNPFNPVSTIRYDLPQASDVSLLVYDILGREVARLVQGYMEPGYHEVTWDAGTYASGIYIARLVTPEYTKSIKMVLLK